MWNHTESEQRLTITFGDENEYYLLEYLKKMDSKNEKLVSSSGIENGVDVDHPVKKKNKKNQK